MHKHFFAICQRLLCAAGASSVLAVALGAPFARAGVAELVQAVADSDIRFLRVQSDVPFMPIGWAKYSYYRKADLVSVEGADPGPFSQAEWNVGLVAPVRAGQRDMLLLGMDVGYNTFRFERTPAADASVLAITPVAGWLRQLDETRQVVAFIAPGLTSALGDTSHWSLDSYAGVLGTKRAGDRLMWVYGGVYEFGGGAQFLYPYLGLQWIPGRHWSVALVVPWPTVTYAPNPGLFFNVGVVPGGASWRLDNSGDRLSATFGSWNLMAGVGKRLAGKVWLHGQVGYPGLRGLQIDARGKATLEARATSQPVINLNLEFRP